MPEDKVNINGMTMNCEVLTVTARSGRRLVKGKRSAIIERYTGSEGLIEEKIAAESVNKNVTDILREGFQLSSKG